MVCMTEDPPLPPVRALFDSDALGAHVARLVVIRRDQIDQIDSSLEIDDFAVAPAPAEEVVARIQRALKLRAGSESSDVLRYGELAIDQANYKVHISGRPVELTYKEYELLRYLALNPDKVHTRETLLNRVWGYDFYGGSRTVDVHIRRLRSKIEDGSHSVIETVRNVGYRLRAD
jgi:DNA-binding response OmpR family regulator